MDTREIKYKIIEKKTNIRELSKKINIHEQTITNWINGNNLKNISKFIELLKELDVDIKKL